jgi:hypothetical protein
VVAAAGERCAHHLQKSHLPLAEAAPPVELLRSDEALHRQMPGPRGEVLTDGEDVDPVVAQVLHHAHHFRVLLAKPDHQT